MQILDAGSDRQDSGSRLSTSEPRPLNQSRPPTHPLLTSQPRHQESGEGSLKNDVNKIENFGRLHLKCVTKVLTHFPYLRDVIY